MSNEKRALIIGISGQDGALLARLLVRKGYQVHGSSRDSQIHGFPNLIAVGVVDAVHLHSAVTTDFRSVAQLLDKVQPSEIYLLAGQSSVGLSFEQPVETLESIALGTLNVLEAIRFLGLSARLYHAGSSECFGDQGSPSTESSVFRPRSPYAVAKASAHWMVANYREAYDLFACTGVLFNHESPLRPARFVTRKVVRAACRIASGHRERLRLGNIDIERDWGWAPEYVDAMWRMLQKDAPEDLVIATGEANSLQRFVELAFASIGLDWRDHVDVDPGLYRPSDLRRSVGLPEKAARVLGWKAQSGLSDVIDRMVAAEQGMPWPMDVSD